MNTYDIADKMAHELFPGSYAARDRTLPIIKNVLDYELSVADEDDTGASFSEEDLSGN